MKTLIVLTVCLCTISGKLTVFFFVFWMSLNISILKEILKSRLIITGVFSFEWVHGRYFSKRGNSFLNSWSFSLTFFSWSFLLFYIFFSFYSFFSYYFLNFLSLFLFSHQFFTIFIVIFSLFSFFQSQRHRYVNNYRLVRKKWETFF